MLTDAAQTDMWDVSKADPKHSSIFQCPSCGGVLKSVQEPTNCLQCSRCLTEYPIKLGLPDFAHDKEYYWGELDRETMAEIVESELSIIDYLKKLESSEAKPLIDYLMHYATDPRRAGWKYLLDLSPGGRLLDFACGWGALTHSLAPHYREAWITDIVAERVAVTIKRGRELGVDNIYGCTASGWPRLPFADESFDTVVVNGALEWLPCSIQGNPKDVQQQFLNEIARILVPDGQFVLGIENRYGMSYFTGKREEYTKLKFISLLPRILGKIYHRLALNEEYRTYTHGRVSLSGMLSKAQLSHQSFLNPYPDYREFDRVFNPTDNLQLSHSLKPTSKSGKLKLFAAKQTSLMKYFSNSFLVFASKQKAGISHALFGRLIEHESLHNDRYALASYNITASGYACVKIHSQESQKNYLLTLPLNKRAEARLQKSADLRTALAHARSKSTISPCYRSGVFENIFYTWETAITGRRLDSINPDQSMEMASKLLSEIHSEFNYSDATVTIDSLFAKKVVSDFLQAAEVDDDVKSSYLNFSATTAYGPCHGDFHLGNILLDESGKLHLVDWDLARSDALPLWDAINLEVHFKFEKNVKWSTALATTWEESIDNPQGRLCDYIKHHNYSEEAIRLAFMTYPILQWHNKMIYGDAKGNVITEGLSSVLSRIVKPTV